MKKYFIAVILVAVFLSLISCAPTLKLLGKRILIDNNHNNQNGYSDSDFFKTMISMLESNYHTVDFTLDVGFIPNSYDILILDAPFEPYTNYQKTEVRTFVQDGGKLIALGEYYPFCDNAFLNNLLSYIGTDILFENNLLKDNDNNYNSNHFSPIITEFTLPKHSIVNSINSLVLFSATSLNVFGDARTVAESSTVVLSQNFVNNLSDIYGYRLAEKTNAFEPLISLTLPVIAVHEVGLGKVIAITDVNLFAEDIYNHIPYDSNIEVHDNSELLLNIINW